MCGSLVEAHGIGLIHRDIKPSNIILTRRGGLFDVAKLVDFGLVKAVDAGRSASLTASGLIVGTPHYMAPEAIQLSDQADARSDLYAVGAVGYFLLTGRPLFEGCRRRGPVPARERRAETAIGPPRARGLARTGVLLLGWWPRSPPIGRRRPGHSPTPWERISAGTWSASEAEAWWQTHCPSHATRRPPAASPPRLHLVPCSAWTRHCVLPAAESLELNKRSLLGTPNHQIEVLHRHPSGTLDEVVETRQRPRSGPGRRER